MPVRWQMLFGSERAVSARYRLKFVRTFFILTLPYEVCTHISLKVTLLMLGTMMLHMP